MSQLKAGSEVIVVTLLLAALYFNGLAAKIWPLHVEHFSEELGSLFLSLFLLKTKQRLKKERSHYSN